MDTFALYGSVTNGCTYMLVLILRTWRMVWESMTYAKLLRSIITKRLQFRWAIIRDSRRLQWQMARQWTTQTASNFKQLVALLQTPWHIVPNGFAKISMANRDRSYNDVTICYEGVNLTGGSYVRDALSVRRQQPSQDRRRLTLLYVPAIEAGVWSSDRGRCTIPWQKQMYDPVFQWLQHLILKLF